MAAQVNLVFGGQIDATWATLEARATAYKDLAETYGLIKQRYGFTLAWDDENEDLDHVDFWFGKNGLAEANLQTFLDQWKALAASAGITRYETTIKYIPEP